MIVLCVFFVKSLDRFCGFFLLLILVCLRLLLLFLGLLDLLRLEGIMGTKYFIAVLSCMMLNTPNFKCC